MTEENDICVNSFDPMAAAIAVAKFYTRFKSDAGVFVLDVDFFVDFLDPAWPDNYRSTAIGKRLAVGEYVFTLFGLPVIFVPHLKTPGTRYNGSGATMPCEYPVGFLLDSCSLEEAVDSTHEQLLAKNHIKITKFL